MEVFIKFYVSLKQELGISYQFPTPGWDMRTWEHHLHCSNIKLWIFTLQWILQQQWLQSDRCLVLSVMSDTCWLDLQILLRDSQTSVYSGIIRIKKHKQKLFLPNMDFRKFNCNIIIIVYVACKNKYISHEILR